MENEFKILTKELIIETCPKWFLIQEENNTSLNGVASIELLGSDTLEIYSIEINISDREVKVKESPVGTKLPSFCPERHINYGGDFCIGLNIGKNIDNTVDAEYWWESLHEHLKIQRVAKMTRIWPNQNSLSHGHAAVYQVKAEKIAKDLGIYDEYQKAIFNPISWFRKLVDHAESVGVNRLEIDDLLTRFKFNSARYRRKRQKVKIVKKMIFLESKRRKEEVLFWQSFDKSKISCCGTMESCQLTPS